MSGFKRISFYASLFILLIYGSTGIYYAFYKPETSDRYLWGAYHVHSTHSDGLSTIPEIAEQARKTGVSLVVLTDHGRPNVETSTLRENIEGVVFVGGSESGLPEGHLNFFGAQKLPLFKLPPFPPDAIEDVREWGGFGVLTYPDDPRHQWEYWEKDFIPDGFEVINITSYFRSASLWGKLGTVLFAPFSDYHFMKDISSPAVALGRWDEILKRGRVLGLYACNAHGGFTLTKGGKLPVPIPSYATVFSLVALGIDGKYESSPEDALRNGDFFSVIRGAGEPQRFEFLAEHEENDYPAGSTLSGAAEIVVRVETRELEPTIVLKRDGVQVASTKAREVRFAADSPGIYRAEVYLEGHRFLSSDVPWILSNPIFVNPGYEPHDDEPQLCKNKLPLPIEELKVEKDEESDATYEVDEAGASLSYSLSKATPDKIDRWIALALRKEMDLSSFDGFYVEASSPDYMRYQVEIRSGERSYYASFKLYPDSDTPVAIPFSQFYATFRGRESIPLAEIDAFFITLNTWSTQTGFSSKLTIKEMGFCRK
jgi:hypothetical protein